MRAKSPHHFFDLASSPLSHSQTKQFHAAIVAAAHRLFPHSSSLAAGLLRSYAANDDILSAHLLFDRTPQRTTYLWNSIIRAHAKRRDFSRAYFLFARMRASAVPPDGRTFSCILRSCSESLNTSGARTVHGYMIASGFGLDRIASSALISAYSRLGLMDEASAIFDSVLEIDLVLWNALIAGYGCHGMWQKGLEMFRRLQDSRERPDAYTLVGVISCLRDPNLLRIGEGVHGLCLKGGYECGHHVRSALISMYSRCSCLESAYRVFIGLSQPDLVTWTAIITGLSHSPKSIEALVLFREMISLGKRPDAIVIAGVISACASLASIGPCKEIHTHVVRLGIDADIQVSCALINSYAKCGFSVLGLRVFATMPEKSLVAYNSVITGLGSHGLGHKAVELFEELVGEGLKPDKATFSSLLCACCHSGLEKIGRKIFQRMRHEFSLEPQMEHYVYMVKLLGMVGKLEEAYDLIRMMPMLPDSGVWGALLWACTVHGQTALGEIAACKLIELEPQKTAYRVMLSNIYAAEEKWGAVGNIRDEIVNGGLQKVPGLSWIGDCSI